MGSARLNDDVEPAAATIRRALGFDVEARRQMPTWTDALRRFIEQADALGVLVMVNGVVGSNNRLQTRSARVPGLRPGRQPRATRVHQRRGHEGRPNVHACA